MKLQILFQKFSIFWSEIHLPSKFRCISAIIRKEREKGGNARMRKKSSKANNKCEIKNQIKI